MPTIAHPTSDAHMRHPPTLAAHMRMCTAHMRSPWARGGLGIEACHIMSLMLRHAGYMRASRSASIRSHSDRERPSRLALASHRLRWWGLASISTLTERTSSRSMMGGRLMWVSLRVLTLVAHHLGQQVGHVGDRQAFAADVLPLILLRCRSLGRDVAILAVRANARFQPA